MRERAPVLVKAERRGQILLKPFYPHTAIRIPHACYFLCSTEFISKKISNLMFFANFSSKKGKMNGELNESTHPHLIPNHWFSFYHWKQKENVYGMSELLFSNKNEKFPKRIKTHYKSIINLCIPFCFLKLYVCEVKIAKLLFGNKNPSHMHICMCIWLLNMFSTRCFGKCWQPLVEYCFVRILNVYYRHICALI